MPAGVQPGDVGEQDLRRTDVRGRPFAADVLFAGLQRETEGRPAGGVRAHADDAPGHRSGRRRVGADEGGVGATEAHRHTEPLRRADGDVGAELAWGSEQRAGEQIGGQDDEAAMVVHGGDRRPPVDDRAGRRGVAEERSETAVDEVIELADDQLDADRPGPRREHRDRLRVGVDVNEEASGR